MIKLSYGDRCHTIEDMKPLYERFKLEFPDLFERWRWLEDGHYDARELFDYGMKIKDFVKPLVEWQNQYDLSLAVRDFRKLIREEIRRSAMQEFIQIAGKSQI